MQDGKVWFVDWKDNRRQVTPEELLELVKENSKSTWRRLVSATEIVKTVLDPDFPEPIANELKSLVLECFTDIWLYTSHDQIAVAYCYYSVHGKTGKRVKRLYRRKLLECITQEPCWEIALHGKRWNAFCKDWQKEALQNFDERFGNDFLRFAPKARADFRASLKRAEEAGVFKEDEAEYIEMVRELFENL
ncbi:hypothetical protein IJ103_03935 [Candidatus Saccharibacteria bacterium]|nr:hypothetical protein [Candidatus Saccharibacteria bacterium]